VVDGHELEVEVLDLLPLALLHAEREGLDAVLNELRLKERKGELRTEDRDVLAHAQQERHGTDVVLVTVREHDGFDIVDAVLEVTEVR